MIALLVTLATLFLMFVRYNIPLNIVTIVLSVVIVITVPRVVNYTRAVIRTMARRAFRTVRNVLPF